MKEDNSNASSYLAIFMGLGVTYGIIFDNLALGISLGVLIGIVFSKLAEKKKIK